MTLLLALLLAFSGDPSEWAGGYGDRESEWRLISLSLDGAGGGVVSFDGDEAPVAGAVVDGTLQATLDHGDVRLEFEGLEEDGVLRGTVREGRSSTRHELLLVRETGAVDEAWAGAYELGPGQLVIVRRSRHLIWTDLPDGRMRVLYGTGPGRFAAGPAFGIPLPREFTVSFDADGLLVERADGTTRRGTRRPSRPSEEFAYESGEVTIRGTLRLPAGEGPFPAIVWVHGSGRQTRVGSGLWSWFFTERGFAFLSVDKRGVGASGGTYEMPDGGHDNLPHMTRRAGDVRAAVAALGARDDVDGERIGLVGASQAGWVIPLAARHGGIDFTIVMSGGATALSIENVFSEWAREMETGPELPDVEAVLERVRRYRPRDSDFREHFAAMDAPGLWLYGGKDRSNPSQLCKEEIEAVAEAHDKDFTVVLFPDGNHGLMQCRWGGGAERGALQGKVPGLYRTVHDWLVERGLVSG